MNTHNPNTQPPTFTEAEWAALKSLVLEFVHYDVYHNHLALKRDMMEESLAAHRSLSAKMSKQELEADAKRWRFSIIKTPEEREAELRLIKKHLAEDAPLELIRWYYEEHDGQWGQTN